MTRTLEDGKPADFTLAEFQEFAPEEAEPWQEMPIEEEEEEPWRPSTRAMKTPTPAVMAASSRLSPVRTTTAPTTSSRR